MTERILSPAIRSPDGEIHTGPSHVDIRQNVLRHLGVLLDPFDHSGEGFLTDTNRWVDRSEAADIANKAGQTKVKVQVLRSVDLILN